MPGRGLDSRERLGAALRGCAARRKSGQVASPCRCNDSLSLSVFEGPRPGGLAKDELYIYEDALSKGRSVVIAMAPDDTRGRGGAWSVGSGGNLAADEAVYRKGFEAALQPMMRHRSYDEAADRLRARFGETVGQTAFRRGYESGQAYLKLWKRG